MNSKPLTQMVELTDEQVALFLLFQEHYDSFGFILGSGILDIRGGSAELHFSDDGRLLLIKRHDVIRPSDLPIR